METILGIKGPDFVMLAADCTQAHSIITLKEGEKLKMEMYLVRILFTAQRMSPS